MRTIGSALVSPSILCIVLASGAGGCGPSIPEPEPGAPAPSPTTSPSRETKAEPVATKTVAAPEPRQGWHEVTEKNSVPVCAFASTNEQQRAKTLAQVGKQVLQADRRVVFGTFAPHCINPACVELSTLECSVERSGNILRLQTRYVGLHKDAATCQQDCREATAGCESPQLEAGLYTLEYKGQEVPLKIPSALNKPCFGPR